MTDLLSDLKALVAKYDAPAPTPQPDPVPAPDPVPTPDPVPVPVPVPVPQPIPTPGPSPMPDVSTAAELAAAIASAQPGDTITLAGGDYGALSLASKAGLTLASADPANRALFSTIALTKCTGFVLDGLAVSRPPQAGDTDNNVRAVNIASCDGITITRCDMELQKALSGAYAGSTNGFTVYLDQSQNVTIRGNDIRGGKRAVMMQYADGVLVEGNDIHDFRAVAVGGGGNNNVTIRGNYLHDAHPWNYPASDHGDFIHLWDGKGKPPIAGIVIEDNTIMQGAGIPIMGISIQNTQGVYFEDVRVANNLVITENNQCLRFDGVRDIDVQCNTFLSPVAEHPSNTGVGGQARFQIGGAMSGTVVNNIWGGISSPLPNCTVTGNLTMKFAQQTAILANPQGTARADFLARADGPGAGLGIR